MSLYTGYTGASVEGLSPKLWANCDIAAIRTNPMYGTALVDDFQSFVSIPTTGTGVAYSGGYACYKSSTGQTVALIATENNGKIQFSGNDADNDEFYLTTGYNVGTLAEISSTAPKSLWFEARLKVVTSVANNSMALFAGLANYGLAADTTLADDTGALKAAADFIGFRTLQASSATVSAIHQQTSQTLVSVVASAATLVADTYVKLGFHYDASSDKLDFFVDNVLVGSETVASATHFPDDTKLAALLAFKVGAAAENKVVVDWIAFAQER